MEIIAPVADERIRKVSFDNNRIIVDLMDNRTITVPLTWFPELLQASTEQREQWKISYNEKTIYWENLYQKISIYKLLESSVIPSLFR